MRVRSNFDPSARFASQLSGTVVVQLASPERGLVQRGGEVIPNLVRVFPEERPARGLPEWQMPEHCPACGAKIERGEGEAVAYCTGPRCPVQLVQRLFHFGSRSAMDIRGLGERTSQQLVEANFVQDVGDLFRLSKQQLLKLDGMGEKSVDKLLAAGLSPSEWESNPFANRAYSEVLQAARQSVR